MKALFLPFGLFLLGGCAGITIELVRVHRVGPEAAAELVLHLKATVVDASEAETFEAAHIRGAVSMPPGEFRWWEEVLPRDFEAPILVYDARGSGSSVLAIRIMKQGYNRVFELRGGLEAWREAGLPVDERRKGKPAAPANV